MMPKRLILKPMILQDTGLVRLHATISFTYQYLKMKFLFLICKIHQKSFLQRYWLKLDTWYTCGGQFSRDNLLLSVISLVEHCTNETSLTT